MHLERQTSRRPPRSRTALLGLALAVTAGISALTTMRVVLTSQEVTVPDARRRSGSPRPGALAARQGLLLRVEGRRNDPRVPADRIVTQEPAAGRDAQEAAHDPGLGEPGAAAADGAAASRARACARRG